MDNLVGILDMVQLLAIILASGGFSILLRFGHPPKNKDWKKWREKNFVDEEGAPIFDFNNREFLNKFMKDQHIPNDMRSDWERKKQYGIIMVTAGFVLQAIRIGIPYLLNYQIYISS